jgi:hypothetical protein
MSSSCDRLKCKEDFITFEDIQEGDKCVRVGDLCTTCKSIKQLKKSSSVENFNTDPLGIVFHKENATQSEKNNFWTELTTECGIQKSTLFHKKNKIIMLKPNVNQSEQDAKKIISLARKPAVKQHVRTFLKVVSLHSKFKMLLEDSSLTSKERKDVARRELLQVLQTNGIKCVLAHDPFPLPSAVSRFLDLWANAPHDRFIAVVAYFESYPSACLEATLEKGRSIILFSVSKSKSKSGLWIRFLKANKGKHWSMKRMSREYNLTKHNLT